MKNFVKDLALALWIAAQALALVLGPMLLPEVLAL